VPEHTAENDDGIFRPNRQAPIEDQVKSFFDKVREMADTDEPGFMAEGSDELLAGIIEAVHAKRKTLSRGRRMALLTMAESLGQQACELLPDEIDKSGGLALADSVAQQAQLHLLAIIADCLIEICDRRKKAT
jgi:hypothetical protein